TNAAILFNTVGVNGAIVDNSGLINGGERGIRFETGVGSTFTASITNNSSGTIQGVDEAIQIQAGAVTAGSLTINNAGTIFSSFNQAIDLSGATGSFSANIFNFGSMLGDINDGLRVGASSTIINSGTINGGSGAGFSLDVDGVNFQANATGTLTNNAGGAISGDRHGINAGLTTNITVTNNAGATITGRNGSGVGSDSGGAVINFGTITGAFSNSLGSDENSPGQVFPIPDGNPDGDGDGIDFDGQATILNHGIIQGTGAGGHGSDGRANTSEGIALGGGSITNFAGATISGVGLGILVDDSSTGNAPFLTTIVNDGTISGGTSFGIRLVSTFADTIDNGGTISGGGGVAIEFGSGDNTLKIRAGSVITGTTNGGLGSNTLDYSGHGATGVAVNLATGAATGTGGVTSFLTVLGSAGGDTLTGSADVNTLKGNAGNDILRGGLGADILEGGDGNDQFIFDATDASVLGGNGTDTFVLETTTALTLVAAQSIEAVLGSTGNDFVNATGLTVATSLKGQNGNDTLRGGSGKDVLEGGLGADKLLAGIGNDTLRGGTGKDQSTGGLGRDIFDFDTIKDSGKTTATRDIILDFKRGQDDIDLSTIDARSGTLKNDKFVFIGNQAFHNVKGEVHFVQINKAGTANDVTMVEGDVNGDGKADFQIALKGLFTLTGSDFIL
ncbi:MAG: hypothetical protein ACRCS9_15410, partial [Hyphomicrobium sp.]